MLFNKKLSFSFLKSIPQVPHGAESASLALCIPVGHRSPPEKKATCWPSEMSDDTHIQIVPLLSNNISVA